jgi:hypothetical protein
MIWHLWDPQNTFVEIALLKVLLVLVKRVKIFDKKKKSENLFQSFTIFLIVQFNHCINKI